MNIRNKILFLCLIVSFISFLNCDNFSDYVFYSDVKVSNEDSTDVILRNLNSRDTNKKKDAILSIAEEKLHSSKLPLRNIIMDKSESLEIRLLGARVFSDVFSPDAFDLFEKMILSNRNTDIFVSIEILHFILMNKKSYFEDDLFDRIRSMYGDIILKYFHTSNLFDTKSKSLIIIAYLGIGNVEEEISKNLELNNPLLGDSAYSKYIYVVNSKLGKNKALSVLKELEPLMIQTKDDISRRKLRLAYYELSEYVKAISENTQSDGEPTNDDSTDDVPTEVLSNNSEVTDIGKHYTEEQIYKISDLASKYTRVYLSAKIDIIENIDEYRQILFDSLVDKDQIIIYKSTSILVDFPPKDKHDFLSQYLIDFANGKYISPKSCLYLPTLRNIVAIVSNSSCDSCIPTLLAFTKVDSLKPYLLTNIMKFDNKYLLDKDIDFDYLLETKYMPDYFRLLSIKNEDNHLLNLISNDVKNEIYGLVLFLKNSTMDKKFEKVNSKLESITYTPLIDLIEKQVLK